MFVDRLYLTKHQTTNRKNWNNCAEKMKGLASTYLHFFSTFQLLKLPILSTVQSFQPSNLSSISILSIFPFFKSWNFSNPRPYLKFEHVIPVDWDASVHSIFTKSCCPCGSPIQVQEDLKHWNVDMIGRLKALWDSMDWEVDRIGRLKGLGGRRNVNTLAPDWLKMRLLRKAKWSWHL